MIVHTQAELDAALAAGEPSLAIILLTALAYVWRMVTLRHPL